ncbi:MAG: 3-dehydroquinate synthase [Terriglobia bacterium]
MQRLRVKSRNFEYDVVVGGGAWKALRRFPQKRYTSVFVLSERALWGRWGKSFSRDAGLKKSRTIIVPSGETSKSLKMAEWVIKGLLESGADRRSLLIAFGGGVVGDLGGFVASTYMRGIDYVQVPTTVVAQVDSAIGGKTGVNLGTMKNLVGTFYPPRLVLAESQVLSTLDARTFRSGFYEVVKHAILVGGVLFEKMEKEIDSLRPADAESLGPILARAAAVKVDVVTRDERESDLRRVLNLGHTFGHALEEATHYHRFLHGEAVGWGILLATRLAERLGILAESEGERIHRLVRRVGPLPVIIDLKPERVVQLLPRDKKAVGGRIHWVLPQRVGKVIITPEVPDSEVAAAFQDVKRGR